MRSEAITRAVAADLKQIAAAMQASARAELLRAVRSMRASGLDESAIRAELIDHAGDVLLAFPPDVLFTEDAIAGAVATFEAILREGLAE